MRYDAELKALANSLKPKMIPFTQSQERPHPYPYFPSIYMSKADGEFEVVLYAEDSGFTVNRNGNVRDEHDLIALEELSTRLHLWDNPVGLKLKSAMLLAELFYMVDGKPRKLPDFNAHKGDRNLRLGLWDIVKMNGGDAHTTLDYEGRVHLLHEWATIPKHLPHVFVLPYMRVNDENEAAEFYNWCMAEGYEGVVAHDEDENIYKIKPSNTVDCVIIGVNKNDSFRHGFVTSLRLGLFTEDNRIVEVGDVGSGIEPRLRASLTRLLSYKVAEDDKTVYIRPMVVAEVEYQDLYRAKKRELKIWSTTVQTIKEIDFYSMRSPRLMRFRTDKLPTRDDAGVEQIEAI